MHALSVREGRSTKKAFANAGGTADMNISVPEYSSCIPGLFIFRNTRQTRNSQTASAPAGQTRTSQPERRSGHGTEKHLQGHAHRTDQRRTYRQHDSGGRMGGEHQGSRRRIFCGFAGYVRRIAGGDAQYCAAEGTEPGDVYLRQRRYGKEGSGYLQSPHPHRHHRVGSPQRGRAGKSIPAAAF